MGGSGRLRSRLISGAASAVLLVGLAGAGVVLAANQTVNIAGFAFSPATVTVNVGDTVTWANNDAQAHTASANSGAWDTGIIAGGGSAGIMFSTAGTFPYHCDIHPTMTGTLVVQGGSSGGGGGGGRPAGTDTEPVPATPTGTDSAPLGLAFVGLAGLAGLAVVLRRTGGQEVHGLPGR